MQRLYTLALLVFLLIATVVVYAFATKTTEKAEAPACTSGCPRPVDEDPSPNIIVRMIELY